MPAEPYDLTLVQLISDQPQPNILASIALRPARVVHVLSSEPRFLEKEEQLRKAIRVIWQRLLPGVDCPHFEEPSVLSAASPSIADTREVVGRRLTEAGVKGVVHYTGGTKNMGIGAWRAALDTGVASFYCDTPRAFVSGETALPPGERLPDLARRLHVQDVFAMQGLLNKQDYTFQQPHLAKAEFGRLAAELQKAHPEAVKRFRAVWRQHCTEGKNRPDLKDIERTERLPIPKADQPELQEIFKVSTHCGWLQRVDNHLFIDYAGAHSLKDKALRLNEVKVALDGAFFESHVEHFLARSQRFIHFLRGVQPAGQPQDADFGETDFLAYDPVALSLTLISCKTTPPSLEHLEATLARKERFGGRFAKGLLCMENPGREIPNQVLDRLRLLNLDGAFASDLPSVFRCDGV